MKIEIIDIEDDCDWNLREYFKNLRFDKTHHLGLGDIRLTIAQQEEICNLIERFYHNKEE